MKRILILTCALMMALAATMLATLHPRPKRLEGRRAKVDPGIPSYKRVAGGLSGGLKGVDSDTMRWLVDLWIKDFTAIYPRVRITVTPSGSHSAGPALAAGTADFGIIAREMLPREETPFDQKFGYKPLRIAVSGGSYRTLGFTDAIAVFVNQANPLGRVTMPQLDAIYSTTRKRDYPTDITMWGQLGLGGAWKSRPIHLVGVKIPNGFEEFLRERLLEDGEWKSGIEVRNTVFPLASLVAKDTDAIGYAGFAYLAKGVKTLAIAREPGGPYYQGTFKQVVAQQYPLSRLLYIFINKAPDRPVNPVLKQFIDFILSRQGQEDIVKDGIFLPLPRQVIERQKELVH